MTSRNWADHIGVGLSITVNTGGDSRVAKIVDVRIGPEMIDRADIITADGSIPTFGSLHLKLQYEGGVSKWTDPVPGDEFVAWATAQRAKEKTA